MEIQRMWNSQSDEGKNIILLTVTEILGGKKKTSHEKSTMQQAHSS